MAARKIKVRHVKFSSAELAYEAPAEIDFKSGLVLRGMRQWRHFLSFKRGYVKLDPEISAFFRNEESVNEALRKAMELIQLGPTGKGKKSA